MISTWVGVWRVESGVSPWMEYLIQSQHRQTLGWTDGEWQVARYGGRKLVHNENIMCKGPEVRELLELL